MLDSNYFDSNTTPFDTTLLTMEELEKHCAGYVWAPPEEFGFMSDGQAEISVQCLVLEKLGMVIRTGEHREVYPGVMQPVWAPAPRKN